MAYPSGMSNGPPRIFDSQAVALHRSRARAIDGDVFLIRQAAEGLSVRLDSVRRKFVDALELGGTPASTRILRPHGERWVKAELDENERLALEHEQFDLVASVLALHSINDLPGVLLQSRHVLRPDGLFMAALFGGDTLFELRESFAAAEIETLGGVSPRVAPFADVRDHGGLMQRAGFALPVADVERTVVRYRNFGTLVADLRAMGETNALAERSKKPLRRETLAAALAHYSSHHAEADGRLRATFDIVYLTGWSPHQSQQQPLKPGSARSRLADALKTVERSAGERVPKR